MLRSFRVENYGLFRRTEIEWSRGFSALTGESGSGKSQLLSAMLCLLGERWDHATLGPFADSVKIRGEFEVGLEHPLWTLLADFDLESDDMLTVTREINSEGRSLFKLQGRTVPRQVVADLASWLIEVMHQGHVSRFSHRESWAEWLDRYLELLALVDQVNLAYTAWQSGVRAHEQLAQELLDDREWTRLREALDEIEQANIQPEEDVKLAEQLVRFRSLNRLEQAYERAYRLIEEDREEAVLSQLRVLQRELEQLGQLDSQLSPLGEQIAAAVEVALDVRHALARWWEDFDRNPLLQEQLEARSDQLAQLKRRYGPELHQVADYARELRQTLDRHLSVDRRSRALAAEVESREREYRTLAQALSEARQSGLSQAGVALTQLLRELEMPSAELIIRMEPVSPGPRGLDSVTFWFTANLGRDPAPLPRSASGGELARIGLSMAVLVRGEPASTLWLDEVDTGLGGRSAARVANMMADLGQRVQIIAITHQPVVASRAVAQVVVRKITHHGLTEAETRVADAPARIEEVARMLSGEADATALEHAQRLLDPVRYFKPKDEIDANDDR